MKMIGGWFAFIYIVKKVVHMKCVEYRLCTHTRCKTYITGNVVHILWWTY